MVAFATWRNPCSQWLANWTIFAANQCALPRRKSRGDLPGFSRSESSPDPDLLGVGDLLSFEHRTACLIDHAGSPSTVVVDLLSKFADERSPTMSNRPALYSLHPNCRFRFYAADWARSSIRRLISENSDTSAFVLRPARVAASISVANTMAVATSALHARQYFSVLPGSSNDSATRPQTAHRPTSSCSVPFGPLSIAVSPWFRTTHRSSLLGAQQTDLVSPYNSRFKW
jgi:hypothetical protein